METTKPLSEYTAAELKEYLKQNHKIILKGKVKIKKNDLTILEKSSVPTPMDTLENFIETIGKIYDQFQDQIDGMALSMPGIIDPERGYQYTGGALRYIDKLETGLKRSEINALLQAEHPRKHELNPGNLTQALKSIASLQVKKNTIPIIIDYDSSNLKLNVVDKGFLIWLSDQDIEELIQQIGI